MELRFNQFIEGIEDGMIAALTAKLAIAADPPGYAKTIATYGGQLDSENLRKAIDELTPRLPALFVSYAQGEDSLNPATQPALPGEPRHFRHDCTFTVIVLDGNARGERQRRRGAPSSSGVYKMIGDVKAILGGLRFSLTIDDETQILNGEPLRYADVDYIARLPELTAYAVPFETWFRYSEPDRTEAGQLVQEVVFAVESLDLPMLDDSNLPGVVF